MWKADICTLGQDPVAGFRISNGSTGDVGCRMSEVGLVQCGLARVEFRAQRILRHAGITPRHSTTRGAQKLLPLFTNTAAITITQRSNYLVPSGLEPILPVKGEWQRGNVSAGL